MISQNANFGHLILWLIKLQSMQASPNLNYPEADLKGGKECVHQNLS